MSIVVYVDDENAELHDATPRIPFKSCVPPVQSQDDESSIMAMGKDMDRLLAIFWDVGQKGRKCTNHWSREAFQVLPTTTEAERYIDDDIVTDTIFCNKATRIAYDNFISTSLDKEQMTPLIWIDRFDSWMNCAMEDLQRRLKGIGQGGRELHVLKTRYNELLSVATATYGRSVFLRCSAT